MMNKAYSKMIDYLIDKTQEQLLKSSTNMKRGVRLKFHLELLYAIKGQITAQGYWSTAKKLTKEFSAVKKRQTSVLYPHEAEIIIDCIKNWNKSGMKKETIET